MRNAITILAIACLCACMSPEQAGDLVSQPPSQLSSGYMVDLQI